MKVSAFYYNTTKMLPSGFLQSAVEFFLKLCFSLYPFIFIEGASNFSADVYHFHVMLFDIFYVSVITLNRPQFFFFYEKIGISDYTFSVTNLTYFTQLVYIT